MVQHYRENAYHLCSMWIIKVLLIKPWGWYITLIPKLSAYSKQKLQSTCLWGVRVCPCVCVPVFVGVAWLRVKAVFMHKWNGWLNVMSMYACCMCTCICVWVLYIPEKAMAPHSRTLAWKIPWTEEPGGLQSMGSLRVGHDWATSLSLFTFMHWRRKWQPTPEFLPGESQGRGSLVGCHLWDHTDEQQGPTVEHRELCSIFCDKPSWKRILKIMDVYLSHEAIREELTGQCKSSMGFPHSSVSTAQ